MSESMTFGGAFAKKSLKMAKFSSLAPSALAVTLIHFVAVPRQKHEFLRAYVWCLFGTRKPSQFLVKQNVPTSGALWNTDSQKRENFPLAPTALAQHRKFLWCEPAQI